MRRLLPLVPATLVALAVFVLAPASLRVASLFAGRTLDAVDLKGGVRLEFVTNALRDDERPQAVQALLQRAYASGFAPRLGITDDHIVIELAGASKARAQELARNARTGSELRMQAIVENHAAMHEALALTKAMASSTVHTDSEPLYAVDPQQRDPRLWAETRETLDSHLQLLHEQGWDRPEATELALGEEYLGRERRYRWRSFLLDTRVVLRPVVTDVQVTFSPESSLPQLQIDFDDDSAKAFAEFTGANIDKTIAIVIDGVVHSAPRVMSRIEGGRVMLNPGLDEQPEAIHELAAALRLGKLPSSLGRPRSKLLSPNATTEIAIARVAIAIAAGVATWLCWLVLAPFLRWRTRRPSLPAVRGRRVLYLAIAVGITCTAVALAFVATKILAPGLQKDAIDVLASLGYAMAPESLSIVAMGLAPFLLASVLVELFALLIPAWRRRRLAGAQARRPLELTSVALGILLAFGQGYMLSVWLCEFSLLLPGDATFVADPGMAFRLLFAATTATGSLLLVLLALRVSRFGFGDGISVLLLLGLVPSLWTLACSSRESAIGLAGLALATAVILGLRVRDRSSSSASLRVPASGILPLEWSYVLASLLAMTSSWYVAPRALFEVSVAGHFRWLYFAAIAIFSVLFTWLFARGTQTSRGARAAAALASALFASAIYVIACSWPQLDLVAALSTALVTAMCLDLAAELRARGRRSDWVPLWQMQRVHLVDAVVQRLRDEEVDCFVRGAYLRTLLQFFAPFVPIQLFVSRRDHDLARTILEDALHLDRG